MRGGVVYPKKVELMKFSSKLQVNHVLDGQNLQKIFYLTDVYVDGKVFYEVEL